MSFMIIEKVLFYFPHDGDAVVLGGKVQHTWIYSLWISELKNKTQEINTVSLVRPKGAKFSIKIINTIADLIILVAFLFFSYIFAAVSGLQLLSQKNIPKQITVGSQKSTHNSS